MKDATDIRWQQLGAMHAYAQERRGHLATLAHNVYGAIAGYFGNSQVLRDAGGAVVQLIHYRSDHTMSRWRDGAWHEGRWLINNGQGATSVAHTRQIDGRSATWSHPFAAYRSVGDRWISPQTWGGHPTYPLATGGVPVVYSDGDWVVDGTDQPPGAMFSLEEGLIPAPTHVAQSSPIDVEDEKRFKDLADHPDRAMEGYFDNTMVMREPDGRIIHVLNYRPDHTVRSWRDGIWVDGRWLLNNAQDDSRLFQTRDFFGSTATWCHSFSPDKVVGDRWIAPENTGGNPPFPIVSGGIPVLTSASNESVISGTDTAPLLVMSLEQGFVPPP